MSNTKLQAARELIQEKKYAEARAILKTMPNDPTAKRWLAKLDEIAPVKARRAPYLIPGIIIAVLLIAVIGIGYAILNRSNATASIMQPTQVVQVPTLAGILPETETQIQSATIQNTETPLPTVTPTPTLSPMPTETPLPSPTSIPTEIPLPTQSVDARAWLVSTQVSPMDDTTTVGIVREADTPVNTWLSTVTPTIVLRCKSGRFEIYLNAHTSFDSDTEYDDKAYVQLRWDREEPTIIAMDESTDGEAVFFADPQETLRLIARHDTLVFGFQPFNAAEQATTFQLAGLGEVIQPLLDACHLPPFGS